MLEIFPERGGDPDRAGKRDPLDPLLWRGAREGEPSWPGGELGPGRPGWHIECAVIALDLLGDRIDVQGGGNDLLFPHHECSAAHAERLTGAGAVRQPLRARRHDRPGRREDVEVPGQPGLRVPAARRPGRPDGGPAGADLRALPQRPHVDRRRCSPPPRSGWPAGGGPPPRPPGRPGPSCWPGYAQRLADDLDTPGALAVADGWADATLAGARTTRRPGPLRATVDALLGIRL